MEISEAIRQERDIQVNLVNYRKDGTPFWMLFHMSPVFGKEDGRVIHFVAVQVPITRKPRRNGGVSLSEDGSGYNEIMFGSCRKEVDTNPVLELGRVLSLDSAANGSFSQLHMFYNVAIIVRSTAVFSSIRCNQIIACL